MKKLLIAVIFTALSFTAFAETKMNADVVIVGAGAAGLNAALTAAQGGGTVILLEKNAAVGGSGNFAEGVFGVETKLQRYRRIEFTKDHIFREEMADTHWGANAALVRRFHNESAKTIDWLMEQGVPFEGPSSNFYNNNPTWHLVEGLGAKLISVIGNKVRAEKNINLMLETPATELIVENGKVVGVKAEDADGEVYNIRAKGAVIVCTGGFADNREMLNKYTKARAEAFSVGPLNKVGDGINMLLKLGATLEDISSLQYVVVKANEPGKMLPVNDLLDVAVLALQPKNIWVNGFGERFADEGIGVDFSMHSNAVKRQLASWSIFDESLKNYYKENGGDGGFGVIRRAAVPIPNLDEYWAKLEKTEKTTMVKGNINEISKVTGIPVKKLKETINAYNANVEKNIDPEFAKEVRYMQKIDPNGTLYAIKMQEAYLTTIGGIKVNRMLQPLDAKDMPIKGVYMAGNDVGGLYSNTYSLTSASGSTYGFAINSGRMAAMQALEDAGIKKK